jgi:hypothetical protein
MAWKNKSAAQPRQFRQWNDYSRCDYESDYIFWKPPRWWNFKMSFLDWVWSRLVMH